MGNKKTHSLQCLKFAVMESGIDFLLGKIAAFMAGKEKSLHKFSQYPLKPNQQLCTSYNL